MNAPLEQTMLSEAITALPLSHPFREFSRQQGWQTLADILEYRTGALLQLPGFTEHLLYEYIDLLESKGLGRLIDP